MAHRDELMEDWKLCEQMKREPSLFNQVFVDDGVVTWPGGLDLAPDTMHEELGKAGVYAVR